MGRPTKSSHLKVLHGTNRKDRQHKKQQPDNTAWDTPIELDADEQIRYERYKNYLTDKGAFKSLHSTSLALLIRSETIAANAANMIRSETDMIQVFENGTKNISPEMTAFKQAAKAFMDIGADFGVTPKSSQSIAALNDGQLTLPFEEQSSPLRSSR